MYLAFNVSNGRFLPGVPKLSGDPVTVPPWSALDVEGLPSIPFHKDYSIDVFNPLEYRKGALLYIHDLNFYTLRSTRAHLD